MSMYYAVQMQGNKPVLMSQFNDYKSCEDAVRTANRNYKMLGVDFEPLKICVITDVKPLKPGPKAKYTEEEFLNVYHRYMALELSSDEAAQFAQQDKNSVRVNEHNKFNAGLVAAEENPEYAACPELARIMKAYGVKNPSHVSAITVALNTMKKDPVECEWIFKTIRQANWHEYKAGYSQYIMKALAIIYEEQPKLMAQVGSNLVPFMQKTNPTFFRDAAGMYGSNYATKARNVASIMMKLLSGDAVMESKLKTLLAESGTV